MQKLDRVLSFIEENIDEAHMQEVEERHIRAVNYEPVTYLPITVNVLGVQDGLDLFPYEEAYYDPEKMMYNELVGGFSSIYNSVVIKDYNPFGIRANHGVGILPSLFGLECRIINGNMPWVESIGSRREVEKLIDEGVPDLDGGLSPLVFDAYKYFKDRLADYPLCSKYIKVTQPDMQSPFDIAHLICGTGLYYYLFDCKDMVHKLLELITRTYIEYRKLVDKFLNDRAGENCMYVHGQIYRGRVILKDDTAVNLSPDMYTEFVRQYDEIILKEFGEGTIHHCGSGSQWHGELFAAKGLGAVDFGNPEMQDLYSIYEKAAARKIAVVRWGGSLGREFLDKFNFRHRFNTGITLATTAADIEEALEILKKYCAI